MQFRAFYITSIFIFLSVIVFLRVISVTYIPGISADEAYIPVRLHQWLSGHEIPWMLPSGRYPSPIYCLTVVLFESLFGQSALVLRLPAVVSGFFLIGLSFFLLKKIYSRRVALLSTLLLASLPATLAYSRLSIEPCQMAIFSLFVIYFALQRRVFHVCLFFFMSITAHPVNVFLFPVCLLALRKGKDGENHSGFEKKLGFLFLVGFILLTVFYVPSRYTNVTNVWHHLEWLPSFFTFARGMLRFLSGVLIYEDFVGPLSTLSLLIHDSLSEAFCFLFFVGLIWSLFHGDWETRLFYFSIFSVVLIFWVVSGHGPMTAGLERYSLFLTPLISLGVVRLLDGIFTNRKWMTYGIVILLSGLLQFSFYHEYLLKFRKSGSEFKAFQAELRDPKEILIEQLRDHPTVRKKKMIMTDGWWSYWPLRYFSIPYEASLKVRRLGSLNEIERELNRGSFIVGFVDGPLKHLTKQNDINNKMVEVFGKPHLFAAYTNKMIRTTSLRFSLSSDF